MVADKGSKKACYLLGHLYEHGLGVTKDTAKAIEFHSKAPERGYESAEEAWSAFRKVSK